MITIHRSTAGTNGMVRVTFSIPAVNDCEFLYLVGWFDEWDESVYPMERMPDGNWALTLELEPGCEYHYRFRSPDGAWLNDPTAPVSPAEFGINRSFLLSGNMLTGSAASSAQPG